MSELSFCSFCQNCHKATFLGLGAGITDITRRWVSSWAPREKDNEAMSAPPCSWAITRRWVLFPAPGWVPGYTLPGTPAARTVGIYRLPGTVCRCTQPGSAGAVPGLPCGVRACVAGVLHFRESCGWTFGLNSRFWRKSPGRQKEQKRLKTLILTN